MSPSIATTACRQRRPKWFTIEANRACTPPTANEENTCKISGELVESGMTTLNAFRICNRYVIKLKMGLRSLWNGLNPCMDGQGRRGPASFIVILR